MQRSLTRRRRWLWLGALLGGLAVQEYAARRYYRETRGPEHFFDADERTAWTPAWHELLTPAELVAGLLAARSRRSAVPRGHGGPVVLVPGFLTTGRYLQPMQRWLAAIGHDARVADIGLNADCLDVIADRLLADVRRAWASSGQRVHLVGHSLGGILARAAAFRAPEAVASVAMLGSPYRGLRVHPALRAGALAVRALVHWRRDPTVAPGCLTFACSCPTVRPLGRPLPPQIAQLAVVSRLDGLTDWRYGRDDSVRTVHVVASHFGLVFSARAYHAIAEHLARVSAAP